MRLTFSNDFTLITRCAAQNKIKFFSGLECVCGSNNSSENADQIFKYRR